MYFVREGTFTLHSKRISGGFWVSRLFFFGFSFSERRVNWEFEEWIFLKLVFLIDIKVSFKYNLFGGYDWWCWCVSTSWFLYLSTDLLIVLGVSYNKFTSLTIFCSWNLTYLKHPKTLNNMVHRWLLSQLARYLNFSLHFIRSNVDFRPTVNYLYLRWSGKRVSVSE